MPRLLLFIVGYNAERAIGHTLERIPANLVDHYEVEVLVIDDSSTDQAFERAEVLRHGATLPFPVTVLFNPASQGYGGNQKIGFHYAIERGFDFVALIHADGRYAPECLPQLLPPLASGIADAVFGSRMTHAGAARGTRILTAVQNRLLQSRLTDSHSGYRIYSTNALRRIPFRLNENGFRFDTEITIQLMFAGLRIVELPIPTYVSHVSGIRYARDVLVTCVRARAQRWSLFHDGKFDVAPEGDVVYQPKLNFESTHTLALERIPRGSRVIDLGCGDGYVSAALRGRGCHTTGVDALPPPDHTAFDAFHQHDLNQGPMTLDLRDFDYALLLDVVEHLQSPERFVGDFAVAAARTPALQVVVSTGNVAFVLVRLMLLFGQFNYGKRGILDLTHTRLFTFGTFRRLFEQAGFDVVEMRGVPAPFPLALGEGTAARLLLACNKALIRVSRSLFSYQILAVVRPKPSLDYLLQQAQRTAGPDRRGL